jgi:hypothetical protein
MPLRCLRLPRDAVLAGLVVGAASAVTMSIAAPVDPGDGLPGSPGDVLNGGAVNTPAELSSNGNAATRLPDRAALRDVPSPSKTIDLLLEMQGRNPGLTDDERPRNTGMPDARRRDIQPTGHEPSVGKDGAGAFGDPEPASPRFADVPIKPPSPEADRSGGDGRDLAQPGWILGGDQPLAIADPVRGSAREHRGVADGRPVTRWVLIPRPVVSFVRENRDMVIGASVAVLLALWAATTFASGRRK